MHLKLTETFPAAERSETQSYIFTAMTDPLDPQATLALDDEEEYLQGSEGEYNFSGEPLMPLMAPPPIAPSKEVDLMSFMPQSEKLSMEEALQGVCKAMIFGRQSGMQEIQAMTHTLQQFGSVVDQKLGQLAAGAAARFTQQDVKLDKQQMVTQHLKNETKELRDRMEVMDASRKFNFEMYGHLELGLQMLPFILCLSEWGKVVGWPIQQRNRGLGLLVHVPSWAQLIWLLMRTPDATTDEEGPVLAQNKMIAKKVRLGMTAREWLKLLLDGAKGVGGTGLFDELIEDHSELVLKSGLFGCVIDPKTWEKNCLILNVNEYARFLRYTTAEKKWIATPLDIMGVVAGLESTLKGKWRASVRQGRKWVSHSAEDELGNWTHTEEESNTYRWVWEPRLALSKPKMMEIKCTRVKLLATGALAKPITTLVAGDPLPTYFAVIGYPLPSEFFRQHNGQLWQEVSSLLLPHVDPSPVGREERQVSWTYPGAKGDLKHIRGIFAQPSPIPSFVGTLTAFKNHYREQDDHLTQLQVYNFLHNIDEPKEEEEDGEGEGQEDGETEADLASSSGSLKRKRSSSGARETRARGGGKCPRALASLT